MADDKLNVNPAVPQDGDDTVTRKTIKLRPAMMTGASVVTPAASPRPAANTDTGNIDLADDTQTRRTIKLKPVAPIQTSPIITPTAAKPAPAPAPAPSADGDDTVTRKTIKLRPTASGSAASTATPAPAAAKPAPTAAPAEESGEKTIRIQRPVKPATTGPAVSPRPVSAAPAAAKPAPQIQSVKLSTVPKPESQTAAPAPAISPMADVEEVYDTTDYVPSKACLIMSIIALICMIYSTLLITVQYLDILQNQKTAEAVSFLVPGTK